MPQTSSQTQTKPTPLWFKAVVFFVALGLVATLAGVAVMITGPAKPTDLRSAVSDQLERLPEPPPGRRIPDFELTDAAGNTVDASIFEGQHTVLDFIYTNCPAACPGLAIKMKQVQDATEAAGIRLVSVSIDPVHDTPEALAAYATKIGADPERWDFLTGPTDVSDAIIESLALATPVANDSQQMPIADGTTMPLIDHPIRLVWIGPDRSPRAYASYTSQREVDLLIEALLEVTPRSR